MSKIWIKAALIRAVKTMAQAAIAIIGTSTVMGDVNWPMVCSASILAGILSILTSLAGLPEVEVTKVLESDMSTLEDVYLGEEDDENVLEEEDEEESEVQ